MGQRPIDEWWNELDTATKQWLADNPGCVVLPRTVANVVQEAAGGRIDQDQHGEVQLSEEEQEFIKEQFKAAEFAGGNQE
jgi:hypothetical protein